MKGIRISKPSSNLRGSTPADMQLDTSLETLPIALFGAWRITVYTGYEVGVKPFLQAENTHGLGYVPMFRGWEDITVNGERQFQSIPTGIDAQGFLTYITADTQKIYVRAEFAAVQYVGATYVKKGYLYVYEKKFEGLPT
jgi:hypothetical protein